MNRVRSTAHRPANTNTERPIVKSLLLAASAACLALLAACGGGQAGQPLPIADGSPEAYTVAYLDAHPNLLVQPEHLIIARLDPTATGGGRQSVPLHIRQAMTLGLGGGGTAEAQAAVAIEDGDGRVEQKHSPGDAATSFTLKQGDYRLVLTPTSRMTAPQTLFLKLADTPTQAARRQGLLTSNGSADGRLTDAPTQLLPLGMASGSSCFNCSFDDADLSNQSFADTFLGGSTFRGTKLFNTDFSGVYCYQCTFIVNYQPGNTNFTNADLDASTLGGNFYGVVFSGAAFKRAILAGNFEHADFSPSSYEPTSLQDADLTGAGMLWAKLQYADLTGATLHSDLQFYDPSFAPLDPKAFVGVKFDNVTPSKLFTTLALKGMDLTDASFAGIDLSHQDLSVAAGVTLSPAGLAGAILSDGTVGTNLSGQDFGAAFAGWTGTVADETSGKDLRGVNLANANLYEADLIRANLSGANLVGANLSETNLYGAALRGAQLGVESGDGSQPATDLSNAYMPLADLSDADLRSANLSSVHLYTLDGSTGVSLQRARLDSANFDGALLVGADFTQASLNNTNLDNAILVNAKFDAATLTNAKFNGASLEGASFIGVASVYGAEFNNAAVAAKGVATSASSPYEFTESDANSHTYAYGSTALGPIATTSGITCPSGASGPCNSTDSLTAAVEPAYPPFVCKKLKIYQYENCSPGWTPPKS
jgi:uncharacterized protein YjbI with pentapeptide repeats